MAGDTWETAPAAQEWETAPARMNPNLAAQGRRAEGVRETMRSGGEFLSSRDEGIDYATGVKNAAFRAGFSRMSNEAEKDNYLNRSIGAGKWDKDSFGAYYIKPEGLTMLGMKSDKPVSIDEQTASRYDVADIAGDLPAIVGGVGGGMAASGVGLLPGLGLAGLGAAGGKAFDEILKNIQGYQIKSPGQVASTLAGEAAMAATGEGVSRAVMPVGKFLLGPGASRMTPEKSELAKSAIEQGFKVRPGSVTDAPILARWEGMVRNIFGDLNAAPNQRAAEAGLARLGGGVQAASKEAAGEAVSTAIKRQRVTFSETMGKRYEQVDALVGNQPIIPTAPLKAQADELLADLVKTSKGKALGGKDTFLREILDLGDAMTVRQAQRLRTTLREASESPDIMADVAMHDARVLKKSVEEAFEQAKTGTAFANTGGKSRQAIELLRSTDTAYKSGIQQFDQPVIKAITRDASKRTVDPDMVVDYLVKPERIVRLRQVKHLAGTEAWDKVKSAHSEDLLSTVVKGTDDPLKSIFDGRAFRDTLDKYGRQVLEEVHGKEWTDGAYKYATALMLAEKQMKLSGGIVAANIALHPMSNLPKLVWLRGLAHVMEQPGTFKYLTEGFRLGPNTKAGAEVINRVLTQAAANARDETGSAKVTLTAPQ